jgi:hypothetical protein
VGVLYNRQFPFILIIYFLKMDQDYGEDGGWGD